MAGRSRVMRLKQSIVNNIDAHTFSGPMKSGTSPSIGVTRNYWYNYATQCNQNPNQVKKSYNNMVFLNINSAQTPVSAGFRPTTNYNYSYIGPKGVAFYDANVKYNNHYYRPRYPIQQPPINSTTPISRHMTGFSSGF
jgi:hypothetical protein